MNCMFVKQVVEEKIMKFMNEHMGDLIEEYARLYGYAEELKSTTTRTTVIVRKSKNTIPKKEVN